MVKRKALVVLSLALIAVVMASAVSADEKVTIDGIDFNVPDGYTEDLSNEIINETNSTDGVTYVNNGKLFENGDNITVIIVSTYDAMDITEKFLTENVGGDDVTIKGVNGKSLENGLFSLFYYAKDGKLVTFSTNNPDDIEKFII